MGDLDAKELDAAETLIDTLERLNVRAAVDPDALQAARLLKRMAVEIRRQRSTALTAADVRAVALEVATAEIQSYPVPPAWREPLARDIADRLAERLGGQVAAVSALTDADRAAAERFVAWAVDDLEDAHDPSWAPLFAGARAVRKPLGHPLETAFDGAARAITGQPSADLDLRLDSALIADPDNRFDSSDAEDLLPTTTLGGPHE